MSSSLPFVTGQDGRHAPDSANGKNRAKTAEPCDSPAFARCERGSSAKIMTSANPADRFLRNAAQQMGRHVACRFAAQDAQRLTTSGSLQRTGIRDFRWHIACIVGRAGI
jgi:hypothetical protein